MTKALSMRADTETITAVASFGTSALAMVIASASGVWEPVEAPEIFLGAAGGLLGGLAYIFNRRIKDPLSALAATSLAVAWCAGLAPIVVHALHYFYPQFGDIFSDSVVTFLVGGILGAGGMEFYVAFLALMDALRKALPDRLDDVMDFILRKRRKDDE